MIFNFHHFVIAAGTSGWEDFIVVIIFAGIAVLKAIFSSVTNKKEKEKQRQLQDRLKEQRLERQKKYKPLDAQGRPVNGSRRHPQDQSVPARKTPKRALRDDVSEPIPVSENILEAQPVTLDIEPDRRHEDPMLRYKKRIETAKQQALAHRRIAQQVLAKSRTPVQRPQPSKQKPYMAAAHKNIPVVEPVADTPVFEINQLISSPENLRSAFIFTEILNKPLCLREQL